MNSRSASGRAPHDCTHSLYACHIGRWVRSYSARNASHSLRSSAGSPLYAGGMSEPFISSGWQLTMRTNGTPAVVSAGKQLTLSSTITSGR